MKQTVSFYQFEESFQQIRPTNFSREGLSTLFDYLEEYEDSSGEEIEMDVIGLCCDFSEDTVENIADYYGIDLADCDDDDEKADTVREYLENEGALVGEGEAGSFVYRSF